MNLDGLLHFSIPIIATKHRHIRTITTVTLGQWLFLVVLTHIFLLPMLMGNRRGCATAALPWHPALWRSIVHCCSDRSLMFKPCPVATRVYLVYQVTLVRPQWCRQRVPETAEVTECSDQRDGWQPSNNVDNSTVLLTDMGFVCSTRST